MEINIAAFFIVCMQAYRKGKIELVVDRYFDWLKVKTCLPKGH